MINYDEVLGRLGYTITSYGFHKSTPCAIRLTLENNSIISINIQDVEVLKNGILILDYIPNNIRNEMSAIARKYVNPISQLKPREKTFVVTYTCSSCKCIGPSFIRATQDNKICPSCLPAWGMHK